MTRPSAETVTQEPRFSPARQSAQKESQDLPPRTALGQQPHGHGPQQQPPGWERKSAVSAWLAPAWQFLKGRARGTQGPGRKSLTAVGAGRAAAAALCPCSQSGLWAPIGPYEPGRRDKEGLAWPGRASSPPPPIARLGKAGVRGGPSRPATPPGEACPLGPGWGRSAAAAPSPLPARSKSQACIPGGTGRPRLCPPAGPGVSGPALTSGLASAAAVRAHPPSGSAEGGRSGAIALRGRPRAHASALGAPRGRRARGARRAAAAARCRAQSPASRRAAATVARPRARRPLTRARVHPLGGVARPHAAEGRGSANKLGSSPGRAQVSAASRRARDGAPRSSPGPARVSRPPPPARARPPAPAVPRRPAPVPAARARRHGARLGVWLLLGLAALLLHGESSRAAAKVSPGRLRCRRPARAPAPRAAPCPRPEPPSRARGRARAPPPLERTLPAGPAGDPAGGDGARLGEPPLLWAG